LPSNPGELLARHDPAAWTRTLAYRARANLAFDARAIDAATPVMLDTTVYLDALKAPGLPTAIATLVARNVVLHCSIACAELAVSVGHLDPAHPRTAGHRRPLIDVLSRMAPTRIVAPTQGHAREARRAVLHDAMMLLTAVEAGAVLISRNIRHMDLLLRFRPDAQVLLYDRAVTT
jgi:hypothetical protein